MAVLDHDHAWLAHLQLLDSALPVGAFAHSWGLETAVATGDVRDAASLRRHLAALVHGRWAPFDARVAVLPWLLDEAGVTIDDLCAIARVAHVSVPSSRSREASLAIGRRLLRLVPELHPSIDIDPIATAMTDGRCPTLHPLVYGAVARELGVSRERAALGWLHATVAGAVGAAVRLMSLGQTDAQRIVAAVARDLPDAWRAADDPGDPEPAAFAPLADEWAMRHPRLRARLFMS